MSPRAQSAQGQVTATFRLGVMLSPVGYYGLPHTAAGTQTPRYISVSSSAEERTMGYETPKKRQKITTNKQLL